MKALSNWGNKKFGHISKKIKSSKMILKVSYRVWKPQFHGYDQIVLVRS